MFLYNSRHLGLLMLAGLLILLPACSVGPDYVKPTVEIPSAFKEGLGWKVAQPGDAALTEKWWQLFNDTTLDNLEEQVNISNLNIVVAEAQFRQARALVEASRSAFYPTLTIGAAASRAQGSANTGRGQGGASSDFLLPVNLSWEIDVWGRIRRSVEASKSSFQASAADLAALKLSVHAELASDYFQLRSLDALKQYLDESVAYYQKSLELTRNRYAAGIVSRVDVLQAETILKSTQASMIDLDVQRSQLEHAIALLIGKPASSFSLPLQPLSNPPPHIPVVLPSELLERRPDIASTERHMSAANAQIGVERAAYYPTVKLGTSIGLEASDIAKWLTWPSRFWSVGPTISETVFDGGLRRAQNEQVLAAYDATVASYRQTVLNAFKEVEDNLAALRTLENEAKIQDEAVESARQTVIVTMNQYKAGIVSYLNVISAQNTELANKRTSIGILERRMVAAVLLVKAVGGGWNTDTIFKEK
ncbi:MAG TPA: efflux transporter outer membrane subunit [Desulfuromonadaceae bacterium]|jgi:NodT family efflux transporter outer membrane factor (OMF) lipoprotein